MKLLEAVVDRFSVSKEEKSPKKGKKRVKKCDLSEFLLEKGSFMNRKWCHSIRLVELV